MGQPMSLSECIQYAERNNPAIQSAGMDVDVAEIRLKQTRLQMTPVVTANAGQNFGYSHGSEQFSINGNYSVNAGIDIFNGLNTYNSIKQSQVQLNQAQLQAEQQKNTVRIQIIRSYLTILMNQEMLDYQRNVLESSRQQVAEGEQKYKVGQILESDYLMLQAQYLADSTSMENTMIAINNEYVTLRNLLNVNRSQSLSVSTPDSARLAASMTVPSLDEVLRRAFDYLPDVKISRNNVEIAEYDVKIAKSGYYPSLSASAGIGTGYNAAYGNGNSGLTSGLYKGLSESIGLNLSIPIYKQSSVRNNVRIKNIQVQQAELALKNTEEQVTKEIEAYHLDLKKAYNNYQLSELQKSAYYANYMTYSQRFQYGAITTVDLLQQQTNYLNILNNYMQNKYNYLMQLKVLDVYMGQPVEL
jgi:outer membrane protein